MEIFINILLALATIAFGFISYYLEIKHKMQKEINGYIDAAEDTGEDGDRKMEMVVDKLYFDIVPVVLRPFLTKKVIESIVQAAFDKIEDYAKKQVEKDKSK